MSIWGGVFAPTLRKHRDWCGNIANHVRVYGVQRSDDGMFRAVMTFVGGHELTEDEEEVIEDFLDSDDRLEELVEEIENAYVYDCPFDEGVRPTRKMIKDEIIRQIKENWQ